MLKESNVLCKHKKSKIVAEENYYEKIKLIGQGTFGKVYIAKNNKNGKIYAIKQVLQDPKYKNRQLSIISRIQNENIIYMIDYYIKIINEDYYLNIIMDFLPANLATMIKMQRKVKTPFDPKIRKILSFQLFKGLYYLELNRICHRDLKPPNILIDDKTLSLKICDFGSAKILEHKQKNVAYICSRYYRAPQLILGSTDYHTQIDVWSAGCILVQFLTLEPIFPGDSSVQQLIQIIKILGTPPEKYIKIYEQVSMSTLTLPKIKPNQWGKVLKFYKPQPQLLDLLSKILTYHSNCRLSCYQILSHPYFHDLKSEQYQVNRQILPSILQFDQLKCKTNAKQIQKLKTLYCVKQQQIVLKQKSTAKMKMQIKQDSQLSTSPNTINQMKVAKKTSNKQKNEFQKENINTDIKQQHKQLKEQ